MNPEQAARRWQQTKIARQRRDVELETFPTTAGSDAKTSHPMFGTGRPASPAQARLPGLVVEPTAPAGLTSWGTLSPATIEHVGGGFHLLACILVSNDPDWFDDVDEFHDKWAVAVWLIRPNGTISVPWVSEGNKHRDHTQGPDVGGEPAIYAPPLGEPVEQSTPKLTRWQEGALLSFTTTVDERQYVDDLSGFWPQSATALDVPWGANVYRWIGHDGTDPIIGPVLELYAGPDGDFPTKGDWEKTAGNFEHDDATVEGFEVIGPSADPNIAVYGQAYNSKRLRVWLLDKNPADHSLSLAARTTIGDTASGSIPRLANPGGLTRIAADRWVAMTSLRSSYLPGMYGVLFNAKTGTIVDTVEWDTGEGFVDCLFLDAFYAYSAGNHLHFDGQATFAAWWKTDDFVTYSHRHTTLTADGDTLTAGTVVEWDTDGAFVAERLVETCEGCLRIVTSRNHRRQALFGRDRQLVAGFAPSPSPEYVPASGNLVDQRTLPSSHPAGYMWACNVAHGETWDRASPIRPKLVRYPA